MPRCETPGFWLELELEGTVKKRAEVAQARTSQLEQGRCNVVPLPRVATRPFRTELTVEQNSLFVANNYRGESFVRESVALASRVR